MRTGAISLLPSTREPAEIYGVGVMTAQRAPLELQNLRITHARPGKGTFVHPDAFDVLQGAALREPVADDDPKLQRRVGDYLAAQAEILQRFHGATNAVTRNKALNDLVAHADRHHDLTEEATTTTPKTPSPTTATPTPRTRATRTRSPPSEPAAPRRPRNRRPLLRKIAGWLNTSIQD